MADSSLPIFPRGVRSYVCQASQDHRIQARPSLPTYHPSPSSCTYKQHVVETERYKGNARMVQVGPQRQEELFLNEPPPFLTRYETTRGSLLFKDEINNALSSAQ